MGILIVPIVLQDQYGPLLFGAFPRPANSGVFVGEGIGDPIDIPAPDRFSWYAR